MANLLKFHVVDLGCLLCGKCVVDNQESRQLRKRLTQVHVLDWYLSGTIWQHLGVVLQILGVRKVKFKDIIDRHIQPAFRSEQACQLPTAALVSYLAFISHSGLLSYAKFDAKMPDSVEGRQLVKQLQQCAVVCTNRGPVSIASGLAIHFPVSLGNKVR